MSVALDPSVLRRRLVAARHLRGWDQVALNAAGHEWGLGKGESARVERGTVAWRAKHTRAFVEILVVPERWFTEPDDDVLLGLQNLETDRAVSEWEAQADALPPDPPQR